MGEGPLPNLPLWDQFLDRHPLPVEEEDAFLDWLTRPGAVVPETLAALEAAYASYRTHVEGET